MPIGAKSFSGSNDSLLVVCGTTAIGPIGITMIVPPSAGAALTASAATRPAAPGRFSTSTVWPIVSFILSATTRAIQVRRAAGGEADEDANLLVVLLLRRRGRDRRQREQAHRD